ncbi:MAG: hydrogen gas-evolving membrane-bound hydrogenase subunit E [Aquihabitans sp.]
MLWLIVMLHVVAGFAALASARSLRRWGLAVAAVAPLSALVWAATAAPRLLADGGETVTSRFSWATSLGLEAVLRADGFSLIMVLVVTGIGALILAYSTGYFSDGAKAARVGGLLMIFAGAMLCVVLSDHLLLLYVGWELTSITSFFLIGTDHENPKARKAAVHALMVTGAGGLAMLAGFVLLGQQAGTWRLGEILAAPPTSVATSVAIGLILLGAFTKSAQYPFHSWLPDAMAAPTPISAYLHSATMVKAGVYLIARLAPAFAVTIGWWRPVVVTVGLVTMVAGALRASRPTDLKRLLAFGTVSQLGFLVVLFGIGRPEATAAGVAVLVGHALFKAALFLVVGIVDHQAGTRDVTDLPRLGEGWGVTKTVAVISAASMAAVPPFAGFVAKESAYAALVDGSTGDRVVLAGIVFGSILTVAYSLRLAVGLVRPDAIVAVDQRQASPPAPAWSFVAPAVVLASLTVLFGLVPQIWESAVDVAAIALDAQAHAHLALWPGLTEALGLSLLTLAVGIGVFAVRRPIEAVAVRWAPVATGVEIYNGVVDAVLSAAARTTRIVQNGSLATYAAVVLTTASVSTLVAMARGASWPGWPAVGADPTSVVVSSLIVAAAVAATVARRRFAAAILLGAVGYAMALLFVVRGAPDLALTQVAVETLFVVVFLVVLRRLPDRFEHRPSPVGKTVRIAVSVSVGAFVMIGSIAFAGSRTERPVSDQMVEQALPEGYGRNVVNVILVDIRGLDTVGEATVLATAAVGIVALARAGRRREHDDPTPTGDR